MAKKDISKARPRLRFPEFQHEAAWINAPLHSIAEPVTERAVTADGSQVLTLSGEQGIVLQSVYFGKQVAGTNSERYIKIARNDFVYNDRTTKQAVYGTIKRLSNHATGIVSPIYKCFRFHSGEIPEFWGFYFESGIHDAELKKLINEGARTGRFNISIDQFLSTIGWRPEKDEQQKIAECLTLLDELITAQARKVEALKDHKRGLMQELFPREGETTPRLRFHEFRNGPEWMICPFEQFVAKSFYGTSNPTSEKGQYPVLRMGNMVDGGLDFSNMVYIDLDRETFESIRLISGDILLNRTNSRDLVGKISVFDFDIECITASYIVTYRLDKEQLDSSFCNSLLNSPRYKAKIKALARPSISQANINPTTFQKELYVSVPLLAEQQRIADCFASLDTEIIAESKIIDALKAHKKGLMQQLFPSLEGA